jgi:hypothetical protein
MALEITNGFIAAWQVKNYRIFSGPYHTPSQA